MLLSIQETIPEIKLDGFQVVGKEMFQQTCSRTAVTMSIWPDSISFSQAAVETLKKCERIRVEVNVESKSILVVPVTAQDKDSIQWTSTNKGKARRIGCIMFVSQLYQLWKWDGNTAYRAEGRLVSANNKVMLLYSFEKAASWKYKKALGNE